MNIKNLFLGIAIFILTISVGIYGISTFMGKGPEYNTYCPNVQIMNEQECLNKGYNWSNYSTDINSPQAKPVSPSGYCDTYTICQKEFDKASEVYAKKVFLAAIPLGVILIIIGVLIFALVAVGAGLMAGGVGIILYGVGGFWRFAEDRLKFAMSLAALVIVIFLAYYANYKWDFFSKKKKK